MGILDLIKLGLKLVIGSYVCAILGYIIISVGSERKNYLTEAFSPIKLFNEILVGNYSFIYISAALLSFFIFFNRLRRTKVDYWDGKGWPWLSGLSRWWH